MEDLVISFETAKLAKEKGLIEGLKCQGLYCIGWSNGVTTINEDKKFILTDNPRTSVKGQFHLALAPTQNLLQKYLREKYNLHIAINIGIPHHSTIMYYSNVIKFGKHHRSKFRSIFMRTYEEALEIGLQEGLKLIK